MTNSDFYILSQFNEMTRDKQESKDQVPEDVQASLTTVGMRIRQAVTQGYSTKQTTFPSYNPPMYEEYMTKSIRKNLQYPSNGGVENKDQQLGSFNDLSNDFEEPEWLRPFDVVMAEPDVLLK